MNPKQLGLIMHPDSGRVFIILKRPNKTQALKDVTTDFALMLAADVLQAEGEGVERLFEARDVYGNVMEIEVTTRIVGKHPGPGVRPPENYAIETCN